jgi:organic hydroperoxide reductase OsmC/OhrA
MEQGRQHTYSIALEWTGGGATGTSSYAAYDRAHEVSSGTKPVLPLSSDVAFRGDGSRYNPEELLVVALSSCHMLSYLHLCAVSDIVVSGYRDQASGTMVESRTDGGRFTDVLLTPEVTIDSGDEALALELHERAHHLCFIANSVNFPVRCEAVIRRSGSGSLPAA